MKKKAKKKAKRPFDWRAHSEKLERRLNRSWDGQLANINHAVSRFEDEAVKLRDMILEGKAFNERLLREIQTINFRHGPEMVAYMRGLEEIKNRKAT
jgi:hypothetical protein